MDNITAAAAKPAYRVQTITRTANPRYVAGSLAPRTRYADIETKAVVAFDTLEAAATHAVKLTAEGVQCIVGQLSSTGKSYQPVSWDEVMVAGEAATTEAPAPAGTTDAPQRFVAWFEQAQAAGLEVTSDSSADYGFRQLAMRIEAGDKRGSRLHVVATRGGVGRWSLSAIRNRGLTDRKVPLHAVAGVIRELEDLHRKAAGLPALPIHDSLHGCAAAWAEPRQTLRETLRVACVTCPDCKARHDAAPAVLGH